MQVYRNTRPAQPEDDGKVWARIITYDDALEEYEDIECESIRAFYTRPGKEGSFGCAGTGKCDYATELAMLDVVADLFPGLKDVCPGAMRGLSMAAHRAVHKCIRRMLRNHETEG